MAFSIAESRWPTGHGTDDRQLHDRTRHSLDRAAHKGGGNRKAGGMINLTNAPRLGRLISRIEKGPSGSAPRICKGARTAPTSAVFLCRAFERFGWAVSFGGSCELRSLDRQKFAPLRSGSFEPKETAHVSEHPNCIHRHNRQVVWPRQTFRARSMLCFCV